MEMYKVQIEGGGLSLNKEVEEDTARRILNILMGGSASAGIRIIPEANKFFHGIAEERQEKFIEARAGNSKPNLSLREHLDEVQAKRNPDKILGIASYIIDTLGADDFASDDIKGYFSKAAEPMPANYNRDFKLVISSGWIAEHHQSTGRYYITKKGREALNLKFSSDATKTTSAIRKRKRKNNSNNGAE